MHLISISLGRPQVLMRGGRHYSTSINRKPATGPLELTVEGVAGDLVSDQRVHGGPDKAICCYPHEHYAYWGERLGAELAIPAFGENFTTLGLLEEQVCVGDTFRIGTAVVQLSQPRQPCWKLANKHNEPRLIAWINEQAYTGFYLRVLTPGTAAANDEIILLERPHPDLTVACLMHLRRSQEPDRALLARLAELPALSKSWRDDLARRLAGGENSAE